MSQMLYRINIPEGETFIFLLHFQNLPFLGSPKLLQLGVARV